MAPDQLEALIEAIGDALADAELAAEELFVEVVRAREGGRPLVSAWYGMWPRGGRRSTRRRTAACSASARQQGPQGHLHQRAPLAAGVAAR